MMLPALSFLFFFFNDTATTEIYTLSLHDALPICSIVCGITPQYNAICRRTGSYGVNAMIGADRKSTRLNSSHDQISYAVFCLKKKKKNYNHAASATYLTSLRVDAHASLVSAAPVH